MQLQLIDAPILHFDGDGVMVPTNSMGLMSEDIAAEVKAVVGQSVEDEVMRHTPIAVGAAMVTETDSLAARYLIHAPLVEEPGMRVGVENIRRATRATLLAADHYQMERIGLPAVGFGEDGVSHDEAARAMIDEVVGFKSDYPAAVAILCQDADMLDALHTLSHGK